MSAALWALVVLPLGSGALLAIGGRIVDRVAPLVAVAIAVVSLFLACLVSVAHPGAAARSLVGLPLRLHVDGLSGVMVVTTTAITTAVVVFSVWDIGADEARARFFGLLLLFSGSMLVTVTAANLLVLLMAWEIMGATSWALIGYWWRDPERVGAANTAFVTTRAADLGLYLAAGAALAGGRSESLALDELDRAADPWLSVITAGVVVAALGKSAQLPFSFWLSRAMQGPSPVSALLHSATMVVAGAYLLLRLQPLLDASGWGSPVVAWTGAATAIALGLVAVAQSDLKQLLAASSCAQIGFMVLAAGSSGVTGGVLQLIAHAAAKSLAFLAAGAWLTLFGAKSLPALQGAARRHRMAGVTFTVAVLTLAGVPPLSLWAAKDVLLAAALEESHWLYGAGLSAAVVSAVYSVKAVWFVWRPVPSGDTLRGDEPSTTCHVSVPGRLPLGVLAVACVALTVLAFRPARDAVTRVLGTGGRPVPHLWEFALSGGLALAASAAAWVWGSRPVPLPAPIRRWFVDWLGVEAVARALLVRPVFGIARALAAFDDRVLDRGVDGAAQAALRLARWTDRRTEQRVDGAVEGVASAARTLGRWARRPQTGQLHHYLAQAIAAFSVLAIVVVLVR
ncbi:NADH-quinone oxidoreductase subunit L [Streptomyces sp. PRKS01-29]|nr:proton-conducting transporter membrane subunit [Streptomyces sabulosicollis]MBI0293217.1 NADH-quinone oxidoreductase subunit L [Streptomyces sabulosicollis]